MRIYFYKRNIRLHVRAILTLFELMITFFIQPSQQYKLFFILSNAHIVDIKYLQGICSPIFLFEDFPRLFLLLSIFLICTNQMILFFWLGKAKPQKSFIFTCFFMKFNFGFCSKRMKTIYTIKIPILCCVYSSW